MFTKKAETVHVDTRGVKYGAIHKRMSKVKALDECNTPESRTERKKMNVFEVRKESISLYKPSGKRITAQ